MSSRLDKERQGRLEPLRMDFAIKALNELGVTPIKENETTISFYWLGKKVKYFPYSGWASGKSIKDGRGLQNLLKQLIRSYPY